MGGSSSRLSYKQRRCSSFKKDSNNYAKLDNSLLNSPVKRDEEEIPFESPPNVLIKSLSAENIVKHDNVYQVVDYAGDIPDTKVGEEQYDKIIEPAQDESDLSAWFRQEEINIKKNLDKVCSDLSIDSIKNFKEPNLSDDSSTTSSYVSVNGVLTKYKKNLGNKFGCNVEDVENPSNEQHELISDCINDNEDGEMYADKSTEVLKDAEKPIIGKKSIKVCRLLGCQSLANGEVIFTAYIHLAHENSITWDQLCKKSSRYIKGLHNQFNCEIKLFDNPIRHRATLVHKISIRGPSYRDVLRCKNALPDYILRALITSEERRDAMFSYQFHRR